MLSSQRLSAKKKATHAHLLTRTTFSGEGAQSLGAKDKMRAWWAHNNQKRKGAKKVMEGAFSGEVFLLSAYTPTRSRLLRRGCSITGLQG